MSPIKPLDSHDLQDLEATSNLHLLLFRKKVEGCDNSIVQLDLGATKDEGWYMMLFLFFSQFFLFDVGGGRR